MLCSVHYNRQERHYEVVDRDQNIHTFPVGADGRAKANRFAVFVGNEHIFRLCARIVARHEHLESRVWSAAEIVLAGNIEFDPRHGVAATVEGSAERAYTLRRTEPRGALTCDCRDFTEWRAPVVELPLFDGARDNVTQACKHIIAYKVALVCRANF